MERYRCGDFDVDGISRRFLRHGREVALEPRILAVILELLARPGELVTRNQLLDAVWGHRHVTRSALNRVIAHARRAFGDDAGQPRFIATVHGAGYRYIGPLPRGDTVESGALGRVWYLDLATMERSTERLRALAGVLGASTGAGAVPPPGAQLPEHILIRIHRSRHSA